MIIYNQVLTPNGVFLTEEMKWQRKKSKQLNTSHLLVKCANHAIMQQQKTNKITQTDLKGGNFVQNVMPEQSIKKQNKGG